MTARPTSELAADVKDGPGRLDAKQRAAVDALVARVTDLEQKNEDANRSWSRAEAQVADCERQFAEKYERMVAAEAQVAAHRTLPEWEEALAAAEAQVAALTQERDNYSAEAQEADRAYLESLNRAKAAEAALDEARAQVAALTRDRDDYREWFYAQKARAEALELHQMLRRVEGK